MKKLLKALSVFAAVAMLGSFVACSSDDDGGSSGGSGGSSVVVKLDGVEKADFATAWDALGTTGDHTITVSKGTLTFADGKTFNYAGTGTITLEGVTTTAYGADVKLVGNPNTAAQGSRELFKLSGKGTLVIKNISMENVYGKNSTSEVQAEVLASTNGKIVAYNSTFLSHQDTIRTEGKAWFYHCDIRGDVDFLWMERNGTVALYEDCLITALGDRTTNAYFTAPRANRSAKIGKGLVVFNSQLVVESGLTEVTLFRSPWNGDGNYYNQAAFVNTTITGMPATSTLVKNNSDGVGDNSVVGWKVDSTIAAAYTSKGSNVGTLSDADKTAEYSNRGYILNKLITIDGSNTSYVVDTDGFWDVTGLIAAAETAQATENPSLGTFDQTNAKVTWDFSGLTFAGAKFDDGTDATNGKTGFQSKSGTMPGVISLDDGTYTVVMDINAASGKIAANTNADGTSKSQAQINAGTVLTVPVCAGAKVTVTATSSGTNLGVNNVIGKVSSGDVSYTATEKGEAIVYAFGGAYISKVTIENLDLTAFTSADDAKLLDGTATGKTMAVVVTGADKKVSTGKTISLIIQKFASYGATPGTTSWASDAESVATVSEATVTGVAAGTANISATVDGVKSNDFEVTVETAVEGAFITSWLDTEAHVASPYAATNSDDTIATGGNVTLSAGTWAYNNSKLDASYSTYGLTYTVESAYAVTDGKDATIYADFIVTAKQACKINTLTVAYGNHGTDNVKAYVTYKKNSDTSVKIADEAKGVTFSPRKVKHDYDLSEQNITLAANDTVTFRVAYYGSFGTDKSPTIGTVSVSGEATK